VLHDLRRCGFENWVGIIAVKPIDVTHQWPRCIPPPWATIGSVGPWHTRLVDHRAGAG
jgi:hypothetical protein